VISSSQEVCIPILVGTDKNNPTAEQLAFFKNYRNTLECPWFFSYESNDPAPNHPKIKGLRVIDLNMPQRTTPVPNYDEGLQVPVQIVEQKDRQEKTEFLVRETSIFHRLKAAHIIQDNFDEAW
jgi:hypothetical protein